VGARGPLSKQILADKGFHNTEVAGDPALFLARAKIRKKTKSKKLGINIGCTNNKTLGKDQEVVKNIVDCAESVINEGWEITFFPMSESDIPCIEKAVNKLNRKVAVFKQYRSIKKTIDHLEKCDVFIGEKLHSVVLAMCAYTPAIMIEYRPKCLDFMMSMGMEEFNVRMDNLSKTILLNKINTLYDDLGLYQTRIYEKIAYYNNIQIKNSLKISNFLNKGRFICQK